VFHRRGPAAAKQPDHVLLNDGPLLCGFNVAIKGLLYCSISPKATLGALTVLS